MPKPDSTQVVVPPMRCTLPQLARIDANAAACGENRTHYMLRRALVPTTSVELQIVAIDRVLSRIDQHLDDAEELDAETAIGLLESVRAVCRLRPVPAVGR